MREQGVLFWGSGMRVLGWVLSCLLLLSCSRPPAEPFVGVEIGAQAVSGEFRLSDPLGRVRTMADFRGKLVVLFFGYTHCPDVCPTTLHDLAQAVKLLGKQGDAVQVLFVTVDPERDTAAVLAKYVPSFDSRFIGLSGDAATLGAALKNFRVYASRQPVDARGGYSVDHSAGLYVFDGRGAPRLYLNYGQKPADIAHDLRLLLAQE